MGLTTAMLVSAGIGAAADLIKSHNAKKAADQAAKAETAATDKALALNQQIYDERKNAMAPYAGYGTEAMGTLGALMGLPAPGAGGAPAQQMVVDPGKDPIPKSVNGTPMQPNVPVTGKMSDVFKPAAKTPVDASAQTASSYVRMRAPNGEEQDVPHEFAPYFQEAGAQPVSV